MQPPESPAWLRLRKSSRRTNSSTAHATAILNGAGIGWLATYGVALGANVVPIDLPLRAARDVWLTYHPDAVAFLASGI